MSKPILEYLPDYYKEILEFKELEKVHGTEIASAEVDIEKLFNDQFVMTSSQAAVKHREQMLEIQADPNIESLDFRKRRIVNRYSIKPPFTQRYLQQRIDYIVGADRANADVDSQNFLLTLHVSIEDASIFKEVEHTVFTIKPANMVYIQQTSIDRTFSIAEKVTIMPLDRRTRLGKWRLGVDPFARGEEEELLT